MFVSNQKQIPGDDCQKGPMLQRWPICEKSATYIRAIYERHFLSFTVLVSDRDVEAEAEAGS